MKADFSKEGYSSHNRVALIRGGKGYFEKLSKLICEARESVHLQMYILEEDETGVSVMESLKEAAARGIAVFILVDGYASQNLSKKWQKELKDAGIHFRWFEPLLRSKYFYFGRRLHHKIVVVDGRVALVGGLNIGNRYNDLPGTKAWLDWAVYAEGEIAVRLFFIGQELWNKSGWGRKKGQKVFLQPAALMPESECLVRARREDWVRRKSEISHSYLQLLKQSRKEVIMMSSYFLPGRQIRKSMAKAAARGVRISVITAGKSDIHIAKHAERYLYRWMLDRKIKLYEYQKNILHGKMSCADGRLTTVGSYNVNFLSAFASIELNLDILDKEFGHRVMTQLRQITEEDCLPITSPDWLQRYGFWEKLWQKICYDLIRLVFYLFTFYFRQHK